MSLTLEEPTPAAAAQVCQVGVHIGPNQTRSSVFQLTNGRPRLIAAARQETDPADSLMEGVRRSIGRLEALSGYGIMSMDGDIVRNMSLNHAGVNRLGVTFAPFDPVRVMILAPNSRDWGLESARRALKGFYTEIIDEYTSAPNRTDLSARILRSLPDLLLIVGARGQWNKKQLALASDAIKVSLQQLQIGLRPTVVYAADAAVNDVVQGRLVNEYAPHVLPPLRVNTRRERLTQFQNGIVELMTQLHFTHLTGTSDLLRWIGESPELPQIAARRFVSFRARVTGKPVLWLSWERNALMAVYASSSRSHMAVLPAFGQEAKTAELAQSAPSNALSRWVPMASSADQRTLFQDFWAHRALNPSMTPYVDEEKDMAEGIDRIIWEQALSQLATLWGESLRSLRQVGELIVSGEVLNTAPSVHQLIHLVLDGLQPQGVVQVYFDPNQLIPILGRFGKEHFGNSEQDVPPLALRPLRETLTHAGTIIAPTRRQRVRIRGRALGAVGDVRSGQLAHIQTIVREEDTLRARSGLFTQLGAVQTGQNQPLDLWVDTRGRPLRLPRLAAGRKNTLDGWRQQIAVPVDQP